MPDPARQLTVVIRPNGMVERVLDADGNTVPGVVHATIDHRASEMPLLRLEISGFEVRPS